MYARQSPLLGIVRHNGDELGAEKFNPIMRRADQVAVRVRADQAFGKFRPAAPVAGFERINEGGEIEACP